MPVDPSRGQMITFALEVDEDMRFKRTRRVPVRVGDTVMKIAARYGQPDDVAWIKKANKIHSARTVLRHKPRRKKDRTKLVVPGHVGAAYSFSVLAGDTPPKPTGGYAKFSTVDRPERTGITKFDGYDPITLDVPIRFENWHDGGPDADGNGVENDIAQLEHMAGRGPGDGAAIGPPPIIQVSVSGAGGGNVNLVPESLQRNSQNPTGPLWRVANIEWDDTVGDGVLRNKAGNRVRQKAVVTLQQHTQVKTATRSATARAKSKKAKRK